MSSEKINGEHASTIEWGGGSGSLDRLNGRLDWLITDRPMIRGAGIGFALAGFGLLVAAEVLPWITSTESVNAQTFPTVSGPTETGLAQLPVSTDIFNLGWLAILAVVTTALAVRPPARRIVIAAGLGLLAAQVALLLGMTRGLEHLTTTTTVLRGGYNQTLARTELPVRLEVGLFCAYGAAALFVLALLLAGGLPRRLRAAEPVHAEPEPGPTDLTVSPAGPADLTVGPAPMSDPSGWSGRDGDIDVSGRYPER
jgi:hypothetical protein